MNTQNIFTQKTLLSLLLGLLLGSSLVLVQAQKRPSDEISQGSDDYDSTITYGSDATITDDEGNHGAASGAAAVVCEPEKKRRRLDDVPNGAAASPTHLGTAPSQLLATTALTLAAAPAANSDVMDDSDSYDDSTTDDYEDDSSFEPSRGGAAGKPCSAKKRCPYPGCGKLFRSPSELQRHVQNIHEGRRYQCPYPGCGKSFTDKSPLTKHIQSAHQGRRYQCTHPGCNKFFTQQGHLKLHIQSAHEGKKYQCALCHTSFNRKAYLNNHITKIHGKIEDQRNGAAASPLLPISESQHTITNSNNAGMEHFFDCLSYADGNEEGVVSYPSHKAAAESTPMDSPLPEVVPTISAAASSSITTNAQPASPFTALVTPNYYVRVNTHADADYEFMPPTEEDLTTRNFRYYQLMQLETITGFDFTHRELDQLDELALQEEMAYLARIPNLNELNFTFNGLGRLDAKRLEIVMNGLANLPHLFILNLTGNELGQLDEERLWIVKKGLMSIRNLTQLDLFLNDLSSEFSQWLKEVLHDVFIS